jgi:hypothetical protein
MASMGQCVSLLIRGFSHPQARSPHLFEQPYRLHDSFKHEHSRRHRSRFPLQLPRLGGQCLKFSREVTETALAHVIGDKAEQAYRRSDAQEKRRKLMEAWAAYCEPKTSDNVVQMHRRDRRVIEIID